MNKKLKIFNFEKPRTLYRYIYPGDLFCYQLANKLYGYGRIVAKNEWGALAEFFDFFTENPVEGFDYENYENYKVLFKMLLDCYCTISADRNVDIYKHENYRIIAQDKSYTNPNPDEITSVSAIMGLEHNADFSIERKISAKDAREKIKINPELDEIPRGHYDTLDLLVLYKPELFTPENAPFMCDKHDRFIEERFKEIHQQELNLKNSSS